MTEIHYYRSKITCDVCKEAHVVSEPRQEAHGCEDDAIALARSFRWLIVQPKFNNGQVAICPECMKAALGKPA